MAAADFKARVVGVDPAAVPPRSISIIRNLAASKGLREHISGPRAPCTPASAPAEHALVSWILRVCDEAALVQAARAAAGASPLAAGTAAGRSPVAEGATASPARAGGGGALQQPSSSRQARQSDASAPQSASEGEDAGPASAAHRRLTAAAAALSVAQGSTARPDVAPSTGAPGWHAPPPGPSPASAVQAGAQPAATPLLALQTPTSAAAATFVQALQQGGGVRLLKHDASAGWAASLAGMAAQPRTLSVEDTPQGCKCTMLRGSKAAAVIGARTAQ
jgi:hypothetical protein